MPIKRCERNRSPEVRIWFKNSCSNVSNANIKCVMGRDANSILGNPLPDVRLSKLLLSFMNLEEEGNERWGVVKCPRAMPVPGKRTLNCKARFKDHRQHSHNLDPQSTKLPTTKAYPSS